MNNERNPISQDNKLIQSSDILQNYYPLEVQFIIWSYIEYFSEIAVCLKIADGQLQAYYSNRVLKIQKFIDSRSKGTWPSEKLIREQLINEALPETDLHELANH